MNNQNNTQEEETIRDSLSWAYGGYPLYPRIINRPTTPYKPSIGLLTRIKNLWSSSMNDEQLNRRMEDFILTSSSL